VPDLLACVHDTRRRPRVSTFSVLSSVLMLFWTRMGSLHALEQTRQRSIWKRWMGQWSPSADTVGRVCAQVELPELREAVYELYSRFRRNKVLLRPRTDLVALILDGCRF